MKKITLLLTAWIIALSVSAQFPGAGAGAGKQGPPSIGHIYGKITDSSGASVNEASVRSFVCRPLIIKPTLSGIQERKSLSILPLMVKFDFFSFSETFTISPNKQLSKNVTSLSLVSNLEKLSLSKSFVLVTKSIL